MLPTTDSFKKTNPQILAVLTIYAPSDRGVSDIAALMRSERMICLFIKYRVNEVAKDFGETSKKILKIVNDNFPGTPKKTMTALEEN